MTRSLTTWAVLLLIFFLVFFAALPWVRVAIERYDDWVYCQTHEPFIQHSWNTNWHHCPVAEYT